MTKFAVIWEKKHQKAGFLGPRSSKITVTKKKAKEKKKERGEGKEEKKKKAIFARLVFTMATL